MERAEVAGIPAVANRAGGSWLAGMPAAVTRAGGNLAAGMAVDAVGVVLAVKEGKVEGVGEVAKGSGSVRAAGAAGAAGMGCWSWAPRQLAARMLEAAPWRISAQELERYAVGKQANDAMLVGSRERAAQQEG